MYFSIGVIKHDRAAQLAVIAAHEFGEHLMVGGGAHIPFETVLCTLKEKLKRDTTVLAAQLLNEDDARKRSAMKVGMAEIVRVFGGDEGAMNFFRQVTTPRATLRFESVGRIRDDIHSAKNRSAVLAAKAVVERYRNQTHEGHTPAEREYIDFLKSIRRTLEHAVDDGCLKPEFASGLLVEIEEAAQTDQRPAIKGRVVALQTDASREHHAEARSKLIQEYAKALHPDADKDAAADSGPTLH